MTLSVNRWTLVAFPPSGLLHRALPKNELSISSTAAAIQDFVRKALILEFPSLMSQKELLTVA